MSDSSIQIINSNTRIEENHTPIGDMEGRNVTIVPKCKPLFVVLIILGLVGLSAAGCGIAGIGAQHHWWSAGLLNHLNQTQSLICICVGGISGTGLLIFGIVAVNRTIDYSDSAQDLPPNLLNTNVSTIATEKTEDRKKAVTHIEGQICITTKEVGYIGQPSQRQLLPDYLAHITLEDGFPLPLDAEDFFIELSLFNRSRQLENTGIPSKIHLPGVLFKDKRDGDIIKLKYKGALIELTIEQQNHGLKWTQGTFEEVFAAQTAHVKKSCNINTPLFGIFDPYWFYRLGDHGVVYKLETHKSEKYFTISHLKEGTSADFRPVVNPEKPKEEIHLSEDGTKFNFALEFHRFQPQDLDIVLNETHLIFYGRFENRPFVPGSVDLKKTSIKNTNGNYEEIQKARSCAKETMFAWQWNEFGRFKGRSVEEMKSIMQKCIFSLTSGLLLFEIPLSNGPDVAMEHD